MVERELDDGRRIAELLASELTGRTLGPFDAVELTDADSEVAATPAGGRAYDVRASGERIASVYVLPERVRVEFVAGLEAATPTAEDAGLRSRPRAGDPPALLVFVAHGADAKAVLDVFAAAVDDAR